MGDPLARRASSGARRPRAVLVVLGLLTAIGAAARPSASAPLLHVDRTFRGTLREQRRSGVLLPVTALPGGHHIGDLGPGAHRFVDWLQRAGQAFWALLPVGPTGLDGSPYSARSMFALDPALISLSGLNELGLRQRPPPDRPTTAVNRIAAFRLKGPILRQAFATLLHRPPRDHQRQALDAFREQQGAWLIEDPTTGAPGYAAFAARKQQQARKPWWEWDPALRATTGDDRAHTDRALAHEIRFQEFLQWVVFTQWHALQDYAAEHGVRTFGDMPIYVAHDGADCWAHPEWFQTDGRGNLAAVAGVPPVQPGQSAQLWGNPLWNWSSLRQAGYQPWVNRLNHEFNVLGHALLRIDHFRGLCDYYSIGGRQGDRWVEGPGMDLFHALEGALGRLPLVAEDLGLITPTVEGIRDQLGLAGMAVLVHGLDSRHGMRDERHMPHRVGEHRVAYAGTHDDNTIEGWYENALDRDKDHATRQLLPWWQGQQPYAHTVPADAPFAAKVANAVAKTEALLVVHQFSDVIGLGSGARINVPGTLGRDNWTFRALELPIARADWLRELTALYERK